MGDKAPLQVQAYEFSVVVVDVIPEGGNLSRSRLNGKPKFLRVYFEIGFIGWTA